MKFRNVVMFAVVLMLLAGCALPATAPSAPAVEATDVPEEVVSTDSVVASDVMTTTVVTIVEEVPITLADVGPKDEVYPTLGGSQVLDRITGEIIVPAHYTCLLTTDPFRLHGVTGLLVEDKASVVIMPEGLFRVETLRNPAGELNAWATCGNLLVETFIAQQRDALSINVGYVAALHDLRVLPMAMNVSSEITSTEAMTTEVEEVITVDEVEVPDVAPEAVVNCVPENRSFVNGYDDQTAKAVVLTSGTNWLLAGFDPSRVNGVQYTDKVLLLVQPGEEVRVEGLGYNAEGFANMYVCSFPQQPDQEVLTEWKLRESGNGTRTVSEVHIVD